MNYKNCKWRNKLVDKLVKECSENRMAYNGSLNNYRKICNSCTIYIVLLVIAFSIIIGISSAVVYFHWYLKKDNAIIININSNTETVIY